MTQEQIKNAEKLISDYEKQEAEIGGEFVNFKIEINPCFGLASTFEEFINDMENQESRVLTDEELEKLRVKDEIEKKEKMKKMSRLDRIKEWFSLVDTNPDMLNFKSDVQYFDFAGKIFFELMREQSVERIVFNNIIMKTPVGDLLLNVKEFSMKLCIQDNGDHVILTNRSGIWERIYIKHVKCEFTRQSFLNIISSTVKYTMEQIMKGDYSNIQFIINDQSKE